MEFNDNKKDVSCSYCNCKFSAAVMISIGLFLAGFFPGYYYYKSKVNSNFVTVKGLAEMNVRADLAIWNLKYVTTGNSLSEAQQEISRQHAVIVDFLTKQGVKPEEIIEGRVETNDLMANPYRNNNEMSSRFIVSQAITVRSNNVDLIDKALRNNGDLVSQGIIFDSQSYGSPVSYLFTGLNDIKPQMLEEATTNASAAAEEFAKSSHSRVGRIRRANQGVFSVLARDAAPDVMETQTIDKTVRVVSTIEYWLE